MEAPGFTVTRWETEQGFHEIATRVGRGLATPLVSRYAGYSEVSDGSVRREVANGGIALVLAFGDPLTVTYDATETETLGAFVVGNHTRPAQTGARDHQLGVEVNLTPAGACAVLGGSLDELTDHVVPIESVLGREGEALVERLAELPSWSARFDLLDHVIGLGPARARLAPEVQWLWRQLVACHCSTQVESLIDEVGWSRRHVTRRFRQQIGLAPKVYARLLRFEHAVELLRARYVGTSLADVAAAAGYYDQAHFNREFRAFAGCTPTEYLAASDPEPQVHFVQDDAERALVGSRT